MANQGQVNPQMNPELLAQIQNPQHVPMNVVPVENAGQHNNAGTVRDRDEEGAGELNDPLTKIQRRGGSRKKSKKSKSKKSKRKTKGGKKQKKQSKSRKQRR